MQIPLSRSFPEASLAAWKPMSEPARGMGWGGFGPEFFASYFVLDCVVTFLLRGV